MTSSTVDVRLRAALGSKEWTAVIEVIEENWGVLTQTNHALLVESINALPAGVLAENPRLVAAKTYVNYLPVNGDARPLRFQHAATAGRGGLLDVLADLTSRSVTARFQGNPAEAVALVREAHRTIAEVSDDAIASIRPVLPDIRLQWAITLELAGELVDANRAYERTFDEAVTFDNRRIAAKAAGSLALNYALGGNRQAAEQWLNRQEHAGFDVSADTLQADTILTTGGLARALLEANDLRFDEAQAALDAAPSVEIDRETWALRLFVESILARAAGHARQQLARVGATLTTQPERHRTTGLNGWLVAMATAELQLALGDVVSANRTLGQLGGSGVRVATDPPSVLRAWTALRRGDARAALVLAAPGLSEPLTSPRITAELLLIVASASLMLGQTDEAREHFAACLDLVVSEKMAIILLRLTPAERATLLPPHHDALGSRLVGLLDSGPSPATAAPVVPLSERERVVLRHLVQGENLAAIAGAEHVSPNTVKTQVRSIYRKLGVNDREGAIHAVTAAPHLLT